MFWGLTTCYRMNSEWTHPRGRLILPPLAVLMSLYFSVSHQIAPCRGSCVTAIVQGLFRQSYCWGIMGAASLPFLKGTISRRLPGPHLWESICILSRDIPWALCTGIVVWSIYWVRASQDNSCLDLHVLVFRNALCAAVSSVFISSDSYIFISKEKHHRKYLSHL